MVTSGIKELRKSQAFLNPPGRPCLDQPSGKFFSFLAGLWILGSIHWAGRISGNRGGVSLTAVFQAPQLRAPGRKPGAARHGESRGIQIPGLLLAQRRGSPRPRSN